MHPPKRLSNLAPSKLYFDIPFQTYLSPIVTISGNGLIPLPAVNAKSLSHFRSVPSSRLLEIKSCKTLSAATPTGIPQMSAWLHSVSLRPPHLRHSLSSVPVRICSRLHPLHLAARRAMGSKAASHQDSFPTIPEPLRLPHRS